MKRWEIEEMLKLRRHPEMKEGEVYLGNVDEETFSHISWKTKRRGCIAYDTSGKSFDDTSGRGFFPAFVQEDEYIKGMETLKKTKPN